MTTRFLGLVAVLLLASVSLSEAQQLKKVPLIGILAAGFLSSMAPLRAAFQQGMVDLGYVVGTNIQIEYRYADGKLERLPELVRAGPT
jgi:putative tryptophan/tyrosine transport system substrate-binding protein